MEIILLAIAAIVGAEYFGFTQLSGGLMQALSDFGHGLLNLTLNFITQIFSQLTSFLPR